MSLGGIRAGASGGRCWRRVKDAGQCRMWLSAIMRLQLSVGAGPAKFFAPGERRRISLGSRGSRRPQSASIRQRSGAGEDLSRVVDRSKRRACGRWRALGPGRLLRRAFVCEVCRQAGGSLARGCGALDSTRQGRWRARGGRCHLRCNLSLVIWELCSLLHVSPITHAIRALFRAHHPPLLQSILCWCSFGLLQTALPFYSRKEIHCRYGDCRDDREACASAPVDA